MRATHKKINKIIYIWQPFLIAFLIVGGIRSLITDEVVLGCCQLVCATSNLFLARLNKNELLKSDANEEKYNWWFRL